MPFARPVSSTPSTLLGGYTTPSSTTTSTSYSSSYNGTNYSLPDPAKLATPWNADSLEKQLENMKREAAASSSAGTPSTTSSNSSSTLSLTAACSTSDTATTAMPSPSQQEDLYSPSSQAMSSSSSSSSPPPQHYFTSHRAMKQRLFQMSDDEAEDEDSENAATPRRDASSSAMSYHERLRSARQDPVRQSISALSGVTIIGRGSISSNRDSIGSISTIGSSNRNSIDESSRPIAMSRAQSENITSSTRSGVPTLQESQASNSTSSDQPSGPIDMPSALQLLQMYPRSASPPHNFDDSRIKQQQQPQSRQLEEPPQPARSRSMSPRSGTSPCTQDAAPLYPTSEEEGGSRPVRRHSRSSMASDLLMSPTMGMSQRHQRSTSPTSDQFSQHQYSSLYTHGGQPLSAKALSDAATSISSLPQASSSQTISSMASGGSSPKRTMSASRSISSNDIAQIVRSFNSRSRKATGRRRSTQGQPLDEGGHFPSHTTSTDSSTTTDTTTTTTTTTSHTATAPANSSRRSRRVSRHPSNSNLKDLIKQKRRQASAPFHTSASVNTSGATSPILASGAQSPVRSHPPAVSAEAQPSAWDSIAQRRARSRRSSAVSQALQLGFSPSGFEEARLRALRGMGEVVMTPSVEEWRTLGLHESLNERSGSESSGSESDTSSSSSSSPVGDIDEKESTQRSRKPSTKLSQAAEIEAAYRPRLGSITSFNQYYGSLPPSQAGTPTAEHDDHLDHNGYSSAPAISRSASTTWKRSPKKRNYRDLGSDVDADTSSAIDDGSASDGEVPPEHDRSNLPTLSRQSLSMPAGTTIPGLPVSEGSNGIMTPQPHAPPIVNGINPVNGANPLLSSPALPYSPSRPCSPIPLYATGPPDPRAYSAVTGLRNIDSFTVQGEAGKGAYGLVRKVREKGPDGRPIGPSLMLKYIVKQRILADAYKRHKLLGVIPMEIHVLDFIRRIYRGPGHAARDPVANLKRMHGIAPPAVPTSAEQAANQSFYGHPNLCQMLDFFEDGENYYLVMSCFGIGQDLFDYVDAAPMGLSITESKSFLVQIVDAIAFLHSHGVVHRDIKDENVILDGKGGVQLIDFGSAAYIKEGKPYFDTFSGTLDFASPEVLRGERYGGKETDIWALGVLAYVILCGECPFWSSEESLAGLYPKCRSDIALQAKADSAEVAAELSSPQCDIDSQDAVDFVHQCLQVSSRDRPPAVHLRNHRFISGKTGWLGKRGWEASDGYSSSASGFEST